MTYARITLFHVAKENILLLIKTLDLYKAYVWENMSIKMIENCGESITVSLKIILEQSLKERKFLELWNKASIAPVHKKRTKT